MEKDRERMAELNSLLREASRAYYQESREIMSNYEYDALYDELEELEKRTGIVLSDSVTQNVGCEVMSELTKVTHDSPMLSLDKTKSVETLQSWCGDQNVILSWKLDGLTIVLTYSGGELVRAVTRGNGYIGEDVTANARQFKNVPLRIPYKGDLVLRGEAVIKYSDFERFSGEYKNPRNLCAGSVRQLDPGVTKTRNVNLFAFNLVSTGPDVDFENKNSNKFKWLRTQGFDVVDHVITDGEHLPREVRNFAEKAGNYDIPSDGLVLLMEDIAYGASLGMTSKFPRNSIAFKWADETEETLLRYIEWSPSRTGLINPVAVFEPVEIEGTTVSRASVHNVSIAEALELGKGDRITVYKANMIIPQIAENLTRSGFEGCPDKCPVCGGATEIKNENGAGTLYCTNEDCPAKKIKTFALMASRDAFNIDGLSEATIEKLIDRGMIKEPADLFGLDRYRTEIAAMEGFGEKSAGNLIEAAEKASETTAAAFIYALGIPEVGSATGKILARYFEDDIEKFRKADESVLSEIEGIGPVTAKHITDFLRDEKRRAETDALLEKLNIKKETVNDEDLNMSGMVFVITGDVHKYANRKELQSVIEKHGGKVSSSVSSKTDYLINNDVNSGSSKNKKARELGVTIISEQNFIELFDLF